MRKILFIFLTLFSVCGCKKADDKIEETKTLSNKIILNQVEVIGTTSVKLTWSKLDNDFAEYAVQREIDTGPNQTTGGTLKRITDKDQTTYIDNEVPYKANVRYVIIGRLKDQSQMPILSNTITYSRPTANLLTIEPYDVLANKEDGILYFIEREGKISLYDIAKAQVVKTINTVATLGYSEIATYNGKKELYVPRNDGWVFVYDALTLDKIAQINIVVKGSSVISRKNLLYISSENNGTFLPLVVVSRVTGLKVSESSNGDVRRIKHIPNTETDMLAIQYGSKSVYKFDKDGKFLGITYGPFSSNSINPDSKLVEFFTDGSKFLATSQGDILNKDMTYNAKLPNGNLTFTAFTFNNDQSIIYAGTTQKTIESYNTTGYAQAKSYTVSGSPIKIFDLATQLLCISKLKEYNSDVWGIAIEKLNK